MIKLKAFKTALKNIESLRTLFLQENNFLIRYNACHERNWSDSYLITENDMESGYGSIKGKDKLTDRDTVFEFYLIPTFRKNSRPVFSVLLEAAGATHIECQSNDLFLSSMLSEFSQNIITDVILFKDSCKTEYNNPGVIFRLKKNVDVIFDHQAVPAGEYILECKGEIVATGGFMLHYNIPFADLYMEVREDCRKKGMGSFLLQELKKECYLHGRVPAARCNMENIPSRATLVKAGFEVCGFMQRGEVKYSPMAKH